MGLSPRRFESFPLRSYIPSQSPDKAAPLPLFVELPRGLILGNWASGSYYSRKLRGPKAWQRTVVP
jgi:hypothetical protein